jgi:hypothetical protein
MIDFFEMLHDFYDFFGLVFRYDFRCQTSEFGSDFIVAQGPLWASFHPFLPLSVYFSLRGYRNLRNGIFQALLLEIYISFSSGCSLTFFPRFRIFSS